MNLKLPQLKYTTMTKNTTQLYKGKDEIRLDNVWQSRNELESIGSCRSFQNAIESLYGTREVKMYRCRERSSRQVESLLLHREGSKGPSGGSGCGEPP